MPNSNVVYLCPNCTNKVREPSQMGRSWCRSCEMYLIPLAADPETMEEPQEDENVSTAYKFTTYRPTGNSYHRGETPEHRFSYVKRVDTLVPKEKSKAYAARCTCKWKAGQGFTSYSRAYRQWETHMSEVEKQQTLSVDVS